MNYLVENLMDTVGAYSAEFATFPEMIIWFITILCSIELVLFVLDGIFYALRSVTRGIK